MPKNYLATSISLNLFSTQTQGHIGLGGFGSIGSLFPSEWIGKCSGTSNFVINVGFHEPSSYTALDGGHVMFFCMK